jgi:hypothetical protein
MLVSTVSVQLVVAVKPLPTESAFRMTLEARLIDGSWVIISKLFMLLEAVWRKKLMLMSENFLIPRA